MQTAPLKIKNKAYIQEGNGCADDETRKWVKKDIEKLKKYLGI